MPNIPNALKEFRESVAAGRNGEVSPRTIVGWFGSERRSALINSYVHAALAQVGLRVLEDFESVNIDAPLTFELLEIPERDETPQETDHQESAQTRKRDDPTLRVQVLSAAIRFPEVVLPTAPLSRAITIMLAKDYSQLPVIANHKLRGAISWRSIGRRLSLGAQATVVSDCLEDAAEIRLDTPLLSAIEQITRTEFALIVDSSRQLKGLVTTADLSREFKTLSEPFLLLRETENYIRTLMADAFTLNELQSFRDPKIRRKIASVDDLSLGEMLRGLERDSSWNKLRLPLDRDLFMESLEVVRTIRNDVMHFDPDPIESERLSTLNEFVRLLQALGECSPVAREPHQ
jgi:CBS domain-containing protein